MEGIIAIAVDNIDREHICCAISDKKGDTCVSPEKAWVKDRFADDLMFRKLDTRGKVFIRYVPVKKAWCPIETPGYVYIDCFWILGQYRGKDYANRLLEECIQDAKSKGCRGLTVAASEKKRLFLSDPDYLEYKGFSAVGTAAPSLVLYYLPFSGNVPVPRSQDCAKRGKTEEKDMVLYYINQYPHTDRCMPVVVNLAKERGVKISVRRIETTGQAQSVPMSFTIYSFFYDGEFVTNEILGPAKSEKFLGQHGP